MQTDPHSGGTRAVQRCDLLGVEPFSQEPGLLFRSFLTPAHRAALQQVEAWMQQAGMAVRLDAAGNLVGRYEALLPGAPALLLGSHIDSVRDGGRYDGALGVMLGIECVAVLAAAGRRLPFALEVVAFGDEEGSRFAASMVCSRALVGAVTPEALAQRDRDGLSLAEAMTAFGLDPARIGEAERPAGDFIGYLEAHIEQGPVLEAEGLALGVVTGIAAQLRLVANFTGRAGHAGTNSMALRRDALAAAAEAILAVERICREGPDDLVGTVGRIQAAPGAVNVVPGDAEISIDIRAGTAAVRNAAAERVCQALVQIGAERGIGVAVQQLQDLPASPCDPGLVAHLSAALQEAGHPPRRLVSGAGHDGMVLSARLPTAMLFVRCAGGISHNPAERVSAADTGAALQAMLGFIDRLGEAHRS